MTGQQYSGTARRHRFTLVEVMVAMGLFTIIMLIMLQFFSGAQRVWTDVERKNETYGDARIAMDMMATMLQSAYYSPDDIPFVITEQTATLPANRFDSLTFPTRSDLKPAEANNTIYAHFGIREINAAAEKDGDLMFAGLYSDNATPYNTAFRRPSSVTFSAAKAALTGYFSAAALEKTAVARYLTSLQFTRLYLNYPSAAGVRTGDRIYIPSPFPTEKEDRIPNLLLIRFTMLNGPDYRQWLAMVGGAASEPAGAQEFRETRERVFTRLVFLGQHYDN